MRKLLHGHCLQSARAVQRFGAPGSMFCGRAAAVAVPWPGAVPASPESGDGKYTLLYQLQSVSLNQPSSNGVLCCCNEPSVKREGWRVPLPFPRDEQQSRGQGEGTCCSGVQPALGPAGGRGGLAKWVVFHFSPSPFHFKHELETKAVFRWDGKGKIKRPRGCGISKEKTAIGKTR